MPFFFLASLVATEIGDVDDEDEDDEEVAVCISETLEDGSTRPPEEDDEDAVEWVVVVTRIERTRSIWALIWSNLLGEVGTKLTDPPEAGDVGDVGDVGCVVVGEIVVDSGTPRGPNPSSVGEDGML